MLELRGIEASYGEFTVLNGIDLVVPDASVVGLIGPNGAGKTTLLRIASGLLEPSAGSVVFKGKDLTRARPNAFASHGICHIPEGRAIFGSMSVRENLVLQSGSGNEKTAIDRAVDAFPPLADRLEQIARTLSGGEQQMLALARAYVQDPTLVMLDEVSLGLAPIIVDQVYEFVGRLVERGVSLILVEQYVSRAMQISDYIYILNRGDMVFAGEPSELDQEEVFERYIGAAVG